jgi:hypothetical protein
LKWNVEREVFPERVPEFVEVTGSGEEIGRVLVERDGENSIRIVECFLYSISVMNIDIDVENSSVNPKRRCTFEFEFFSFRGPI